jgi:hypothetical protein
MMIEGCCDDDYGDFEVVDHASQQKRPPVTTPTNRRIPNHHHHDRRNYSPEEWVVVSQDSRARRANRPSVASIQSRCDPTEYLVATVRVFELSVLDPQGAATEAKIHGCC